MIIVYHPLEHPNFQKRMRFQKSQKISKEIEISRIPKISKENDGSCLPTSRNPKPSGESEQKYSIPSISIKKETGYQAQNLPTSRTPKVQTTHIKNSPVSSRIPQSAQRIKKEKKKSPQTARPSKPNQLEPQKDYLVSSNKLINEIRKEFEFSSDLDEDSLDLWDDLDLDLEKNLFEISANQSTAFEVFLESTAKEIHNKDNPFEEMGQMIQNGFTQLQKREKEEIKLIDDRLALLSKIKDEILKNPASNFKIPENDNDI